MKMYNLFSPKMNTSIVTVYLACFVYMYAKFQLTLECVDHRRILKDEPGHILYF